MHTKQFVCIRTGWRDPKYWWMQGGEVGWEEAGTISRCSDRGMAEGCQGEGGEMGERDGDWQREPFCDALIGQGKPNKSPDNLIRSQRAQAQSTQYEPGQPNSVSLSGISQLN